MSDAKTGTGKWAEAGVPHKGWSCREIIELDDCQHRCEMCETRLVRFVHVMQHPDYPDRLRVGCVCAGHMEGSLIHARERETGFKTLQRRRRHWLTRKWRCSTSGNEYLNADGFNVAIFDQGRIWGARVKHRSSGYQRVSTLPYRSSEAAKLAAFDVMIQMKRRQPWR